jgi:ferredoxin
MRTVYRPRGHVEAADERTTSRRAFLSSFLTPWRQPASGVASTAAVDTPQTPADATPLVAVVQGRFCLAYQRSFCSTCVERCPVAGAITLEQGLPRINPTLCNGCRLCHEVCPAPRNAILLLPKRSTPKLSS